MEDRKHIGEHAVQREMNLRLKRFFENDWPHSQILLGSVSGQLRVILWALGAMTSVITALTIKLILF